VKAVNKALIVYGTRYGAAASTSKEIAKIFRQQGLETEVVDAKKDKVNSIAEYGLVVVGSGIQINRWTSEPEKFIKKNQKGLLKGYTAILDPAKLGYDLTAIIYVQTEGGYLDDVEAELEKTANVIGVYEVTGDFDVIAVAKLRDRDSLNILIKNLLLTPNVKRTLTNITLNVVKEDFKLPL